MSSLVEHGSSVPEGTRLPENTEIVAATGRILNSETFRRCPRLREFLTFVVDRSVQDRSHEINEYSLGVQVFGKPADYNPSLDNVVRANARQLRTKLAEYYASEGSLDEWLIDIPKGAYVPVWRAAPHASVPEVDPEVFRSVTPPKPNIRIRVVLSAVALCLLIATAAWLGGRSGRGSGREVNLLTDLFSNAAAPLTMVLDDPYLPVLANWSGKSIGLKDYLDKESLRAPFFAQPEGAAMRGIFQHSEITSASTAQLLVKVAGEAAKLGQQIEVRHCRDLHVRDLGKGNFIFFGGVGSNPWVDLLQKNLNFQHFFEPGGRRGFQNQHQLANEPKQFAVADSGDTGKNCYARVAIMKSPVGSGRIALIGGTSRLSTEAAGEFALSASGLAEVMTLCPGLSHGANEVEVILETTSLGGSPVTSHVVAHRCGPFKTS